MKILSIKDIIQAKNRINSYIHNTPVFSSAILNKWLRHEIYFKAECMQKIGAFKARGACNTIAWLAENKIKPKLIVTNSSGNHAQAVAWAATQFGIPSTIYMPENASEIKIQATKSYGGNIIICKSREIVDKKVEEASKEKGVFWLPPYNHEQVIAGQGTAAYEAIKELGEIDAVFAPCGGGGLLSGTVIATRALFKKAEVIGAEPLNANDAAQSLRMNAIQTLTKTPNTIADGAMTLCIGNITFEYLKMLDNLLEIEEEKIIYWTQWLNHLLKIQVEPTSAMAMEAARLWLSKQSGKKKILVIISGGNINHLTMKKIWEKDFLCEIPRLK